MSSQPWSIQPAIDALATDDFFLVVDVSLTQANRTVTGTQLLDFIEDALNSLNNDLDMNSNEITNFDHIRGIDASTAINIKNNTNEPILNLVTSSDPVNYIEFISGNASIGPTIKTLGANSNVDLRFNAKGAGEIKIQQDMTATNNLIVQKRLKLVLGNEASTNDLDLDEENVFEISGTTNILRMSTVDWQIGSIVVLHLIDTSSVLDAQGGAGEFEIDGDLNGPAVLTVFLKSDEWHEISRTIL